MNFKHIAISATLAMSACASQAPANPEAVEVLAELIPEGATENYYLGALAASVEYCGIDGNIRTNILLVTSLERSRETDLGIDNAMAIMDGWSESESADKCAALTGKYTAMGLDRDILNLDN